MPPPFPKQIRKKWEIMCVLLNKNHKESQEIEVSSSLVWNISVAFNTHTIHPSMTITSTANFFPEISNKDLLQKYELPEKNTIFFPDQNIFKDSPVERHRNMSRV